ncbi:MAG TPA: glycosyltransferase family 39 protein [Thermoanaerobaculia bacterium]|nr:glycosyltransferase family 39 protein [Thermoanaerobaculia bacterium]
MYPFLAAAVYLATNHNQTALVLLQLLIAAATIWVVGTLPNGNIAALLLAIHPGFIRYSSVLHPFVLDSFFFIAAAAALLRFRHDPSLRRGMVAALLIGLGALTRPTILLYLIPLIWTAAAKPPLSHSVQKMLLLGGVALAVVAPWTIRNAFVHHTFMLTRSGSGLVFWLGNNPHSTGSATDTAGQPVIRHAPPELLHAKNEVERDRVFREAAWQYIRARPLAAIGRFAQRVYYFWWFSPQWGAAFSPALKLAYRAWWVVLLTMMAVGATRNRSRDVWFLVGIAVLISLIQSVYYVEGRHRLAIEPLLLPLAALGMRRRDAGVP